MRRAPLPHLCALLAGAAAALAVGCGDRSNLIPVNDASSLKDQLAAVQSAVAAGDCSGAQAALDRASATAQSLTAPVDRRLRRRINAGIQQLRTTVPKDCVAAQTQTTTTPTTTTTVPTQTTPTETTTTTTVPTETTTTTVPTTPTTTPTTPTTTPTTPSTPETTPGTSPDTGGTPDMGATP